MNGLHTALGKDIVTSIYGRAICQYVYIMIRASTGLLGRSFLYLLMADELAQPLLDEAVSLYGDEAESTRQKDSSANNECHNDRSVA